MNDQRSMVLAIDDTPVNLLALGAVLGNDIDLQVATSGMAGLALAAKSKPDLILLDVMMPEVDGYETYRRLRMDPLLQNIPVIFLTALSSGEDESAGLALGACDYIIKPIQVEIVRHRIRNLLERESLRKQVIRQRDELGRLNSELTQASLQLEATHQREIATGHNIQRSLLLGESPKGIDAACFDFFSDPSQGIDGDFYDIRRLHTHCFDVLVGDVMGKGVQAALIGAGIKTAYHQALADLLIARFAKGGLPTPADIINQLHRMLTPRLMNLDSFATLGLYRFDLEALTLSYVNAGHTPGLLVCSDQVQSLLGDNLPIGVLADEIYTEVRIDIGCNDSLLLFSDGITEACNASGEEFGQERLAALVAAWPKTGTCTCTCTCTDKLNTIRQALRSFTDARPATDDQTALIVELHANSVHP
jgi:serine phosphatase RsbU (regulator of sigma subunit)